MKPVAIVLSALLTGTGLHAQNDIPLLRPEERQAVDRQADEFNEAILPAVAEAAKSTVRVWAGNRRLAYGTVVGDGMRILTKWSEIARAQGNLRVEADGAELRAVTLTGVYESEDIAVLEIKGVPLTPVKWSFEKPELGTFLVAAQPDGRPAAFGVVSVLERNLRDTDQAFLGVIGTSGYQGPGVKIDEISPGTGAEAAGLKPGDVILKVGERTISGLMELRNALTGVMPGDRISMRVESKGAERTVEVILGNRPDMPQFSGQRLQQMERMGGPISRVRDSFTRVIQTDMRPKPNQVGGPVADLKGNVLGITVARADRTRSFVMPAAMVTELLETDPGDPELAQVEDLDEPAEMAANGGRPQQRMVPGGEERMQRHLSDMRRLTEHMRREMETLEALELRR